MYQKANIKKQAMGSSKQFKAACAQTCCHRLTNLLQLQILPVPTCLCSHVGAQSMHVLPLQVLRREGGWRADRKGRRPGSSAL